MEDTIKIEELYKKYGKLTKYNQVINKDLSFKFNRTFISREVLIGLVLAIILIIVRQNLQFIGFVIIILGILILNKLRRNTI